MVSSDRRGLANIRVCVPVIAIAEITPTVNTRDQSEVTILKDDNGKFKASWQPLEESAKLFAEPKSSANAPIQLGHIYLVRITDTKEKSFQLIAKLMVIAYRPEEAVTVRWELL